jgi:hypothetical protein
MAATRGPKAVFVSPQTQALRVAKKLIIFIFISLVVNDPGKGSTPSRTNPEKNYGQF